MQPFTTKQRSDLARLRARVGLADDAGLEVSGEPPAWGVRPLQDWNRRPERGDLRFAPIAPLGASARRLWDRWTTAGNLQPSTLNRMEEGVSLTLARRGTPTAHRRTANASTQATAIMHPTRNRSRTCGAPMEKHMLSIVLMTRSHTGLY